MKHVMVSLWWWYGKFSIGRQSWGNCISCSWDARIRHDSSIPGLRSLWSMQMLLGSGWTWGTLDDGEGMWWDGQKDSGGISRDLQYKSKIFDSIVQHGRWWISNTIKALSWSVFFPIEFPFAWHEMQRHTQSWVCTSQKRLTSQSGPVPNNLLLATHLSRHNGHAKLEGRHSWPRTWGCTKMIAIGCNAHKSKLIYNNYNQLGQHAQLVNDWSTRVAMANHDHRIPWFSCQVSPGDLADGLRLKGSFGSPKSQRSHPIPITWESWDAGSFEDEGRRWRHTLDWNGHHMSSYSTR